MKVAVIFLLTVNVAGIAAAQGAPRDVRELKLFRFEFDNDTFVGSGTRYLSDAGRAAIEQLFAESFS